MADWYANHAGGGDGTAVGTPDTLFGVVTSLNALGAGTHTIHLMGDIVADAGWAFAATAIFDFSVDHKLTLIGEQAGGTGVEQQVHVDANGIDRPVFEFLGTSGFIVCKNATVFGVATPEAGVNHGFVAGAKSYFYRCRAINCARGFTGQTPSTIDSCIECYAEGCSDDGMQCDNAYRCVSRNNGDDGIVASTVAIRCVATGNADIGILSRLAYNCTADNNGASGIFITQSAEYCLSTNNTEFGYDYNGILGLLASCASYNNTEGRLQTAPFSPGYIIEENPILLTQSPYTDADGNDYSLNNITGGGASCLNKDGVEIGITGTLSYHDVGAAQSPGDT